MSTVYARGMAKYDVICDIIVGSLIKMEKPDLSMLDWNDRSKVLRDIFNEEEMFQALCGRVNELSNGNVSLTTAGDCSKFKLECMGAARYLELVSKDVTKYVIFTKGPDPFIFDSTINNQATR